MIKRVLNAIRDWICNLIYRPQKGERNEASITDIPKETFPLPPQVDVNPAEPPEVPPNPITQNLGDTTVQAEFAAIESVARSTLPTVVDNAPDPNPQVEPEISYSADAKSGEGKHKSASESRDATDSHDGSVEAPVNQPVPNDDESAVSSGATDSSEYDQILPQKTGHSER